MKKTAKISLIAALVGVLLTPSFAVNAQTAQVAQAAEFTTTATGYKKASDVKYNESGDYIANWGARGEDCVFLSKYAESFYTGSYVYDTLSKQSGGSTQSNASSSALYKSLQTLMKSKQTYQTSYDATKKMYCYTDCVSGNSSKISSFYSGKVLNGAWDSGATWNREHTWPNSKGLAGNDENDIMMLRPTWVQENSSRGNTAYGEGSGYYDPNGEGTNVRGDCARIFLYVYVRWGNTQYAWGTSGVMQSMSVLLKWMEEDPVDTWEMGRNDVVEDITGTRNVFVDYPEYAWLLFGKDIPDDMPTPSGKANEDISKPDDTPSGGNSSSDNDSSSGGNSSSDSDKPSTNEPPQSGDETSGDSSSTGCEHEFSDWITILKPTLDKDGKRMRTCYQCGESQTEVIPKCEHEFSDWIVIKEPTENKDGKRMRTCYKCGESVTGVLPKTGGCNGSVSGIAACSALLIAAGAAWFVNKRKEQ